MKFFLVSDDLTRSRKERYKKRKVRSHMVEVGSTY